MRNRWASLGVFTGILAACLMAGAIGGLFTGAARSQWYAELAKPAWTPPGWLFGPVWSALYVTMAVAAWLVWRRRGFVGAARPLALFAFQLAMNAVWPAVFFGLRQMGAAFIELLGLWAAIVATTIWFFRVAPWAGALMLPYLAWVTFAGALNFAIWRMNV